MRHFKKFNRKKKLSKTEEYIKKTSSKKIGLFLPTLSQYQNMTADGRRMVRSAITKLKDQHHPTKQAVGFDTLMTMSKTGMYGVTNSKRAINQERAIGALKVIREHENVSKREARKQGISMNDRLPKQERLKYGVSTKNANSSIIKQFVNYMETPIKNLRVKPDEVANKMSEFYYYRVKGGYIIARKQDRSFVKFAFTSREAYDYVINHNAIEASEYF